MTTGRINQVAAVQKHPSRPGPQRSECRNKSSTEPESCAGTGRHDRGEAADTSRTMAQSFAQCSTSAHQRFGEAGRGRQAQGAARRTDTPSRRGGCRASELTPLPTPRGADAGASRTGSRLQMNECTSCSGTSSSSATAPEPRARGRCVAGGARAPPADTDNQRGRPRRRH